MRRYLLAPVVLVLAACQPTGNEPSAETAPPPDAPALEDKGPTVAEVQAAITSRASANFERRPLARRLPDGVKIPVAHHRLFENLADAATGSEYRAMVEVFDPAQDIEAAFDREFTGRGFTISDKSDVGGERVLTYKRTYGPTVTIRIGKFKPGAKPQAPGASGTLHLTWISPK